MAQVPPVTPGAPSVTHGDRLFAALQYVLPQHALSRLIYAATRSRAPWIKESILRIFLKGYRVNMQEAQQSDPFAFATFNEFFTRALRPDARPVAPGSDVIVSPVDGTVSQCAPIRNDLLIQAKGRDYTVLELLGGDHEAAEAYRNGSFACIYLAPYNYHRIHMPCDGVARRNLYVPGALFSVNAATARAVPRLFARNERLVCDFDTPVGRMAVVLVGALFVGSIETVHCGEVNPPPRRRKSPERIAAGIGRRFAKGDELGRFNMGSTVVLLFQNGRATFDPSLATGSTLRMGQAIARGVVA
jgi:phosphatidylserine decarboxylase